VFRRIHPPTCKPPVNSLTVSRPLQTHRTVSRSQHPHTRPEAQQRNPQNPNQPTNQRSEGGDLRSPRPSVCPTLTASLSSGTHTKIYNGDRAYANDLPSRLRLRRGQPKVHCLRENMPYLGA